MSCSRKASRDAHGEIRISRNVVCGRGHNPFSEWNPEENTQALRRSDNPDTSNRGVLVVVAACNLGDQMKGSARCTDRFQCGMRRLRGDSNFSDTDALPRDHEQRVKSCIGHL
jgi:hypothetical protein